MTGHATPSDLERVAKLRTRVSEQPDAQTLVELGSLLFEPLHQEDEAVRVLEKAIAMDPKNVDARFWLAKVWVHEFLDEERAKLVLKEALELDSNRADCLMLMASVLQSLGSSAEECISLLERAVRQAPDWPASHEHLAQALLDLDEIDRAKVEAHKALNLLDENASSPVSTQDYYESAVMGKSPAVYEYLKALLRQIDKRKLASERWGNS